MGPGAPLTCPTPCRLGEKGAVHRALQVARYVVGNTGMSFNLLYHYLIEPTPGLVEVIRREVTDTGFADVLLERLIVPKTHVAGHGADDANAMQIKLAFLSMLRVDRAWESPEQFERLFGSPTLSAELFDRWWTLTEGNTERFEDLEKFVGDALPLVAPAADVRVANWLRGHAAGRRSTGHSTSVRSLTMRVIAAKKSELWASVALVAAGLGLFRSHMPLGPVDTIGFAIGLVFAWVFALNAILDLRRMSWPLRVVALLWLVLVSWLAIRTFSEEFTFDQRWSPR